jgi:class 3 adenylate cyclase
MDTFNNLGSEHGEERMPELLNEFLELVEHEAQRRSERMLEQAAISDRLRAVASRRK